MQKLILFIILFSGAQLTLAQHTRTLFDQEIIYGKPNNIITFQYNVHNRPARNKPDTVLRDTTFYDQSGNSLESHSRTGLQQAYSLVKYAGKYNSQKIKTETMVSMRGGNMSLKYDDQRRISELDNFLPNGSLAYKGLYKHDAQGNPVEYKQYDGNDSLRLRRTYLYNQKGFVTEEDDYSIRYNTNNPKDRSEGELFTKIVYSYEAFDDKGNWTKRTTYKGFANMEPTKSAITERKIFYYK